MSLADKIGIVKKVNRTKAQVKFEGDDATWTVPFSCLVAVMERDEVKDEIKRRVDIVEVISQYVPLQRAGRRYKARCPFHQEKTPSFFVDPAGGFWHCFGCGAGGDVFSFLMQIEGISFPEAGERLAPQVGLPWRTQPGAAARTERRKLLRRAVQLAADHFPHNLRQPRGAPAVEYLHKRGFTDEVMGKFHVGYAADEWDDLLKLLGAKGIGIDIAQEAGLVKESERGSHYDVFRNRIIFPITDAAGKVIAFGGRAMDPDEPAKYLNSPDTPLFSKGRHLYAVDLARQQMVADKYAIVVEGYTDVIALHQAGIGNVVATLGTAMTADHLKLLGRYVDEVILCYDADAAGMQAALRNIELFERGDLAAKILVLPEGQDPDDYVRKQSAEQFKELVGQAVNLVEYRLAMVFRQHRNKGADGMVRAAREAVEVLLRAPDRTRRDEFIARAADLWAQDRPGRTEGMQRALQLELRRRASQRRTRAPKVTAGSPRDRSFITDTVARYAEQPPWLEKLEKELLAVALQNRELAERVFAVVAVDDFAVPEHQVIAEMIANRLQADSEFQPHQLVEDLPEEGGTRQRGVELLLAPPVDDLDDEMLQDAAAKLRKHRSVAGLQEEYEIRPTELLATEIGETAIDDFHKLQQRVAELAQTGELTHEHPEYQEFLRVAKMFHGKGQFDFIDSGGAIAASGSPPQHEHQSPESTDGEEDNQGS